MLGSLSLISKIVEFDFGNLSRAVSICQELPKKKSEFFELFLAWPSIFAFTKEFLKNTNENLPSDQFCSHLRQDGQIDLPSSPDCHIFSAVSENTHQPTFNAIMAIWPYSQMAIMASNVGNMGLFGNGNKNVAIW